MVLADLGADVLKVERPDGGDDCRHFAPTWNDMSVPFYALNRNKRSAVLDLKTEAGVARARDLAGDADVVLQSFRPGVLDALGLGHAQLKLANPRLVYASVSAFGDEPEFRRLAGYDPIVQAFSGLMSMTGEPGREPVRVAASLTDLTTGMWLALGVMAALRERDESGVGRLVTTSLVDAMMMLLTHQVTWQTLSGDAPQPLGSASPLTAPYQAFPVTDGYVMIAAGNDRLFARLCTALGLDALVADERFATVPCRVSNRMALATAIGERTASMTAGDLTAVLTEAAVPCTRVNDLGEALRHPVIAARGVLTTAEGDADYSAIPIVDLPLRVDGQTFGPHVSAPRFNPSSSHDVVGWRDKPIISPAPPARPNPERDA